MGGGQNFAVKSGGRWGFGFGPVHMCEPRSRGQDTTTYQEEAIMPIRDDAPLGAPCWIDLTTSDVDRAQEFYGPVFGWTYESAGPEYGGYLNAAKAGPPLPG